MDKNKSLVVTSNNIPSIEKVENFLFDVDKDLEEIFVNDKIYEIAYTLEYNNMYNWANISYLNELEKQNLPPEFFKKVVIFMILHWLPEVVLLKEKFDINTDDISVDIFLNWIKEQGKNIFASDYFEKFIFLCSDVEKLIYEIWKLWYINITYDFTVKYNLDIPKYTIKENILITKNLEKYINSFSLMQKMTLWWYYDWYNLVDTLFEKTDKILDYILKLFSIKNNEKGEFEELKEKHFNILYKKLLEDIEDEIMEKDFSIVSEFEYNLLTKDRFEEQFFKSLKESLIKLNYANWFVIHFLDITWSSITFSISNNNYNFWYTYWLLQKDKFYKNVMKYYNYFVEKLEKNNMEFVVILARSNWTKDFTDNFNEKYLKKAA